MAVPLERETAERVMISRKERASSRYTVQKDLSFCWKKFLSLKENKRDVEIFPSHHREVVGFYFFSKAPPVPFIEGLMNNPEWLTLCYSSQNFDGNSSWDPPGGLKAPQTRRPSHSVSPGADLGYRRSKINRKL